MSWCGAVDETSRRAGAGIWLAPLLLAGCAGTLDQPAQDAKGPDANAAHSSVELGPVRATVAVDPAKASLSDDLVLRLTIDYVQGVTVGKPPFGDELGDFVIRGFRAPLPRAQGAREILEQTYTLEPTRTGQLAVAPISIRFTDTRPDGDNKEHTIETEGLTVEIASVVDADVPSLADLRPPGGPVRLPGSRAPGILWLMLPVVLLGISAAVLWYVRKRRRPAADSQLSAQELAYLELQQIIQDGLAQREIKQYYVELTGVVRRYIERTKGIHAPEQTTDEFLREISTKRTFPADESARLKSFLEAADLVKFASHQPRHEDIEESFRRAQVLIGLERLEAAA